MSARAESTIEGPGLGELVGVAVNAPKLLMVPGHMGPLDLVAALGYASRALLAKATDLPELLSAVLAPKLWRAKYGYDHEAVVLCVLLFEQRLLCRPYLTEIELADAGIVRRFAAQVVHEWLSDACDTCGGSGWLEVGKRGNLLRPQGRYRNSKLQRCGACRGTGRRRPNERERRRALAAEDGRQVHHLEYADLWCHQFVLALTDLREIARTPRGPLQSALGRGRVRA